MGGAGREGWRVRGAAGWLAGRLGGDGWRVGCAARTIAGWGIQTLSLSEMLKRGTHGGVERYLRGRSESNSHGLQSSGEAGVGGICGWGQGRKVCGSFSKAFIWEGCLKLWEAGQSHLEWAFYEWVLWAFSQEGLQVGRCVCGGGAGTAAHL